MCAEEYLDTFQSIRRRFQVDIETQRPQVSSRSNPSLEQRPNNKWSPTESPLTMGPPDGHFQCPHMYKWD
jgi:hypothetical protein